MIILICVALFSYLLKITPFFLNKQQNTHSQLLISSVEYAVCFIIGSIIINVAFNNATLPELIQGDSRTQLIILLTLSMAFISSRYTRSILKSLFISIATLAILLEVIA